MKSIQERLVDLKARQEAGDYHLCPRCGRDTMKPDLYTNAMSRQADIMVCDECGWDEAKLAFMHSPGSLYGWAAFQPERPEGDFKDTPGKEAWERIEREQTQLLTGIYKRWLGRTPETDLEFLRLEAYETCAGLTKLWLEPFQAGYDVADGRVLVRFRKVDGRIQMAADLLPA